MADDGLSVTGDFKQAYNGWIMFLFMIIRSANLYDMKTD